MAEYPKDARMSISGAEWGVPSEQTDDGGYYPPPTDDATESSEERISLYGNQDLLELQSAQVFPRKHYQENPGIGPLGAAVWLPNEALEALEAQENFPTHQRQQHRDPYFDSRPSGSEQVANHNFAFGALEYQQAQRISQASHAPYNNAPRQEYRPPDIMQCSASVENSTLALDQICFQDPHSDDGMRRNFKYDDYPLHPTSDTLHSSTDSSFGLSSTPSQEGVSLGHCSQVTSKTSSVLIQSQSVPCPYYRDSTHMIALGLALSGHAAPWSPENTRQVVASWTSNPGLSGVVRQSETSVPTHSVGVDDECVSGQPESYATSLTSEFSNMRSSWATLRGLEPNYGQQSSSPARHALAAHDTVRHDVEFNIRAGTPLHDQEEQQSGSFAPNDDGRLLVPASQGHFFDAPSPTSTASPLMLIVLPCEWCGVEFTGKFRKGNLARHRKQKHAAKSASTFPCEDQHCHSVFQRKDARLKHYRRHHPGLVTNALKTRGSQQSPDSGSFDSFLAEVLEQQY